MTTTRMAYASLLGTIADTAGSVSSVVNSVSNSAEMLNDYIKRQRIKQQDYSVKDIDTYRKKLIRDSAREISEAEYEIEQYRKSDPVRADYYDKAELHLKDLFEKADLKRNPAPAKD